MNLISTRVAYFYQPPSVGAELSWLECSEYFWMKKNLIEFFAELKTFFCSSKLVPRDSKKVIWWTWFYEFFSASP